MSRLKRTSTTPGEEKKNNSRRFGTPFRKFHTAWVGGFIRGGYTFFLGGDCFLMGAKGHPERIHRVGKVDFFNIGKLLGK